MKKGQEKVEKWVRVKRVFLQHIPEAQEKGQLIRFFYASDGKKLQDLNTTIAAQIYRLIFVSGCLFV